ncbi:uncharacterized protein DEA37_0009343 [Paragonimus westermani]|uniref:Cytosolic endo-beta-N-acetylglucosaminidase TIM barrel domain-containing protein n=1 Tax=Paragonimus westermani TaxID=34504 RepID=A0A5J4NSK8_9TREM|nr:uncharacterized protein DEA37_0009343 [Paragonimus westermani]
MHNVDCPLNSFSHLILFVISFFAPPRQAVRVYGTLIFESVEDDIYKSVFWKPDSDSLDHMEFANRLDLLRRSMCFEGWLLNFEVCFPEISWLSLLLLNVPITAIHPSYLGKRA